MTTAKDIMTPDVVWVNKDTPVREAGRMLIEKDITGMPVLAEDMTVVGVITEKDLLRLYTSQADAVDKTVEHFMSHPAVWYREDEDFERICYFMLLNYFRRVPVISADGKLVGVISRKDVLRHVMNQKCPCDSVTA